MSSNAEVREKELEKLQEEIGEGYEVNDIQGRAKLRAEYDGGGQSCINSR